MKPLTAAKVASLIIEPYNDGPPLPPFESVTADGAKITIETAKQRFTVTVKLMKRGKPQTIEAKREATRLRVKRWRKQQRVTT